MRSEARNWWDLAEADLESAKVNLTAGREMGIWLVREGIEL